MNPNNSLLLGDAVFVCVLIGFGYVVGWFAHRAELADRARLRRLARRHPDAARRYDRLYGPRQHSRTPEQRHTRHHWR